MADPRFPENPDDVTALAARVTAGTDGISVPADLVVELPAPAEPSAPREKALWAQIRDMNAGERIKLALKGNKDARMILLRDANRQIRRLVLLNPRISEEEILMIAKDRNTDEEILVVLAESRDWTKAYGLRIALVENARTPVPHALRLLATLGERDLARLGRSKNVPNVVAATARRFVLQMRERHGG
jgi:hypothetical protein